MPYEILNEPGCLTIQGITQAWYCFLDEIEEWPFLRLRDLTYVGSFTFYSGKGFKKLDSEFSDFQYNAIPKLEASGVALEHVLSGFIIGSSKNNQINYADIFNKQIVVLFLQPDGKYRVLGKPFNGARILTESNTETVEGGVPGDSYKVSFRSQNPACYFTDTFPEEDNSGVVELQSVDWMGNILPEIIVTPANNQSNWRSFDFADFFLSLLSGTPGTTIENAIIDLTDDLIQAGIWEYFHALYPLVNGTSADHALNLKYPFAVENAMKINWIGSPTHDSNGVTMANNLQFAALSMNASVLEMYNNGHFSLYYRSYTALNNNLEVAFAGDSDEGRWFLNMPNAGAGTNGMSMCSPISQINPSPALTLTGLWLLNRTSNSNLRQVRNGVLNRQITNSSTGPFWDNTAVSFNSIRLSMGSKNPAFISIGRGLSTQQESDMYAIVQAFQTALGRQV